MPVEYQHVKTGRVVRAREGSRLAKLMAKDDGYKPYAEAEEKPLEKRSVAELKVYAEEQGIELTATKKADVLAEIQAAEADGGGENQGGGE
jgi:hypothetical protein